jgi:cellulose biosynthesis protein BcsQ
MGAGPNPPVRKEVAMTQAEVKAHIERNLIAAGLPIEDVRVQPDIFLGWLVAVVSPGFAGMVWEKRLAIVLQGLEEEIFQWRDLLTPEEREVAGNLPLDSDLEDIPMWPEALARPRVASEAPVIFPSDLDTAFPRPIVTSFYALHGGVGCSTALAYTARILASGGYSVLCVDMDLEAPALAAFFGKENEVRAGRGLVSILLALDQGTEPDMVKHMLRLSESDALYCLPAGIPDADYARCLRLLHPEAWYREERNPLRAFLDGLSSKLPFTPDVVLLNTGTGFTPLSAPLLFDLSDLVIVAFFPHAHARSSTGTLVQALLHARTRREMRGQRLTPELRFLVSPVPVSKDLEMQRYRARSLAWIADWLAPLAGRRGAGAPPVDAEQITHVVPYQKRIATAEGLLGEKGVLRHYQPIADWLEPFLSIRSDGRVLAQPA